MNSRYFQLTPSLDSGTEGEPPANGGDRQANSRLADGVTCAEPLSFLTRKGALTEWQRIKR